jgi:preprotein translocase subunit SecB
MEKDDVQIAGLEFHLFDIFKVSYERGTSEKDYTLNINIKNAINIEQENPSIFQTIFHIEVKSKDADKPLNIQIEAVGHFKIIGNLTNEVIDNYLNISSPAIVYPYIRAFLANFTLQTGIKPINLPPINFANKKAVRPKKSKKNK